MKRTGSAIWKGGLKDGKGRVSTESGTLDGAGYSFSSRFEATGAFAFAKQPEPLTNPEELVAAAHAGCYAMQLSGVLGQEGLVPDEIRASAVITAEMDVGGFTIRSSHLTVEVRVPGADGAKVAEAAETARKICPISRLLNAEITIELKVL
jgi:osmotically inducible protein OsmC